MLNAVSVELKIGAYRLRSAVELKSTPCRSDLIESVSATKGQTTRKDSVSRVVAHCGSDGQLQNLHNGHGRVEADFSV
jgi:hypothetical protein